MPRPDDPDRDDTGFDDDEAAVQDFTPLPLEAPVRADALLRDSDPVAVSTASRPQTSQKPSSSTVPAQPARGQRVMSTTPALRYW
ncbi:hypothetical protein GCM10025762_60440 [Haloechinothrix salitolerans]